MIEVKYKRKLAAFLFLALLLSPLLPVFPPGYCQIAAEAVSEATEAQAEISPAELSALLEDVPRPEYAWPMLDDISALAYIVADADSGEIIFGHNTAGEAYPASMTKIMTALVVLEHAEFTPERPVYFTEYSCAMPAPESVTAGFVPGEVAPTISCLYLMMCRSANEVANALAATYGGSIEAFVQLMNAKALELGCEHTNFVDPCGFGYVDHHTTAEDMVKIIRRAMSHRLFQTLVTTKVYSAPPTNMHPMSGWSNVINSNYLMVFQDAGFQSPWLQSIDGVKTGHTDLAGDCLATAATTHDGRRLIAVIFNAVYVGPPTTSYVGASIMSRTLLEEGAKRLGSPRAEEVVEDRLTYAWPTMADPLLAVATTEATTAPQYTLTAPTETAETLNPVPEGSINIRQSHLAILIICLSLFLMLSLILAYVLLERRKRERRQRNYLRERRKIK